jgi:hypothetical protein
MEKKKAVLRSDILKAKAHEIWSLLPQCSQQQEPKWSNGSATLKVKKLHSGTRIKLALLQWPSMRGSGS